MDEIEELEWERWSARIDQGIIHHFVDKTIYPHQRKIIDTIKERKFKVYVIIKSRQIGITTLMKSFLKSDIRAYYIDHNAQVLNNFLQDYETTGWTPGGTTADICFVDEWAFMGEKYYRADFDRFIPKADSYVLTSSINEKDGLLRDIWEGEIHWTGTIVETYSWFDCFYAIESVSAYSNDFRKEYLCRFD